tara:strand:+ start:1246 stop:1467 length:222 start_codon:yes stop_codon:yes gene_type:complete
MQETIDNPQEFFNTLMEQDDQIHLIALKAMSCLKLIMNTHADSASIKKIAKNTVREVLEICNDKLEKIETSDS